MPVQDDERERELVRMFNLDWNPAHQRSGVDALLDVTVDGRKYRFEIEVKSTTGDTVATARDVGMAHIERWRRMLFVIGFYSKQARRPELQKCLCLTPVDMEPWIETIEAKALPDYKLAVLAAKRLQKPDLFSVCGEQETYSLADAKATHKQQWTSLEYAAAQDVTVDGKPRISQARMLGILQLRSQYIAERGATLNNPHVSKTHLRKFFGTDREVTGNAWAARIREIAEKFIREHPGHRAAVRIE